MNGPMTHNRLPHVIQEMFPIDKDYQSLLQVLYLVIAIDRALEYLALNGTGQIP